MKIAEYLTAAGATAVIVLQSGDGVFNIATARPRKVMLGDPVWVAGQRIAGALVRRARAIGGSQMCERRARLAVVEAARLLGVTLTPHDVAVERARDAVCRLDEFLHAAARDGRLHLFNVEYKQRRRAALAAGVAFISYRVAYRRFRHALIARLIAGGVLDVPLFSEVFDAR